MLTKETIKQKAQEWGASVCGIGTLNAFEGCEPGRDPKMILPNARCIIGFGFAVPRGFYRAMEHGNQFYGYTTMGVKYLDEEFAEIFLLRMGGMIEDCGYDACLQKSVPNLRIKGDKETNPEVADTYELIHAVPVTPGKPSPDVIIDFGVAAQACGIGQIGDSGHILSPLYGPYMRWCFIITDAPLEPDEALVPAVCDHCGACRKACPGHAIGENGIDSWQCAVYYKGAHKSNPEMKPEFLISNPEKESIINGDKHFDAESARRLYPEMNFLPHTQWGYAACLCGKKCDIACYEHLKKEGVLKK